MAEALAGADDGDLFLEMRHSEMLSFDDGHLRNASYDQSSGFGLRAIAGEADGFAHAGELSQAALKRAAEAVRSVASGHGGELALPPGGAINQPLYTDENPLEETALRQKSLCCRKWTAMPAPLTRVSNRFRCRWPVLAGGAPDPAGWLARQRIFARWSAQCIGHGRTGWPHGNRLQRGWRAGAVWSICARTIGKNRSRKLCGWPCWGWSLSPPRQARWMWFWGRAGRVLCCMRLSDTAWKGISTARELLFSQVKLANRWQRAG